MKGIKKKGIFEETKTTYIEKLEELVELNKKQIDELTTKYKDPKTREKVKGTIEIKLEQINDMIYAVNNEIFDIDIINPLKDQIEKNLARFEGPKEYNVIFPQTIKTRYLPEKIIIKFLNDFLTQNILPTKEPKNDTLKIKITPTNTDKKIKWTFYGVYKNPNYRSVDEPKIIKEDHGEYDVEEVVIECMVSDDNSNTITITSVKYVCASYQ